MIRAIIAVRAYIMPALRLAWAGIAGASVIKREVIALCALRARWPDFQPLPPFCYPFLVLVGLTLGFLVSFILLQTNDLDLRLSVHALRR